MDILEPSLSFSLLRLLKENKQTGGVITGEQVSTNCNKLFLVFYLYNTYILPSIGWKNRYQFFFVKTNCIRWLPGYGASLIVGSQVRNAKFQSLRSHHGTGSITFDEHGDRQVDFVLRDLDPRDNTYKARLMITTIGKTCRWYRRVCIFQVNHLHLWLQHLMRCELVLFKGYHGLPWGHVLLWNWNWIGLLKGCCCLPRGHLLLWNQRISPLAQQVGFQNHNRKHNK